MVIAATITMIIAMTFQIPYGTYGVLYALTISRESSAATASAVKTVIIAFALSGTYILVGSIFFVGEPILRFVWVVGSLFLTFYALSASSSYIAATRFGYLVVITIPLWDSHILPDLKLTNTLWAIGAMTIASVITLVIELIFARLKPWDDLVESLADRLARVEAVLNGTGIDRPVDDKTAEEIARLSVLGTSRLRRILQRASYSLHRAEQMGAVIALTGRLVDLAANLANLGIHPSADVDRKQIRDLADVIGSIRADLLGGRNPPPVAFDADTVRGVPLLREMQKTTSLISDAFADTQPLGAYSSLPPDASPAWTLLKADAFSNSEHTRFALRGCLAASLCYVIYNALDWPGISTAVATCLVTALTTIGASRQRQIMRFAGALLGGAMGIVAQIFILPSLDSIAGFTVLFAVAITVTAWVAASGPRLSYLGVQTAAAYCLLNLQEFKIETSLVGARDRVVGILLGLFAMWLVFDQLWGTPAAREMKRMFISCLRLLAEFSRGSRSKGVKPPIDLSYALRETIDNSLDKVRALADGVLFEFGSSRQHDLALRSRIVAWQPQLRMIFVTSAALLKYQYGLPGFELPKEIRVTQQEFDESLAQTLEGIADRMEGKAQRSDESDLQASLVRLERATELYHHREPPELSSMQMQSFLTLSRRIENLAASLDREFGWEDY